MPNNMGMGAPASPQQPGIFQRAMDGLGGLLGGTNAYGGMLDEEQKKALQKQALLSLGSNLLANSGYSPQRTSFGQALGNSVLATQQQSGKQGQDMLEAMLLKTRLQKASEVKKPSDVQSFEYAKANGFAGSFEEWKRVAAAKQQSPAGIQEYEYFSKLTPAEQKQFLSLQRSPVVPQVVMVNGVPTLVDRTGATAPNPLSTQQSEIDAATAKAQAEAAAKARGAVIGETQGSIEKKALTAGGVNDILDLADPLIDAATGSGVGAGKDKLAAAFGVAPQGAQAIAQLQILQASLMMAQPRMEGPQGEKDVILYQQAAGNLGDPTVPNEIKKAAIKTIRNLQNKYAEAAGQPAGSSKKRVRVDAQGNVIQ
jgi:hypothetical protein